MKNRTRKCPPGFKHRKGYTRKNTGTHVKGVCIRSTSPYSNNPLKAQSNRRRTLNLRLSRAGKLGIGTRKRCPKGMISRAGYVRRISSPVAQKGYTKRARSGKLITVYPKRKSTYVGATCVKDLGKPGKLPEDAPKIGPLRKGELQKYGYSYKLPENLRKVALKKAIQAYGPLNVYRKLNAVSKLTTQTAPQASKAFSVDRNWIKSTYSSGGVLKAF